MAKQYNAEITFAKWFTYLYLPLLVTSIKLARKLINKEISFDEHKLRYWTRKATKVTLTET